MNEILKPGSLIIPQVFYKLQGELLWTYRNENDMVAVVIEVVDGAIKFFIKDDFYFSLDLNIKKVVAY